MYMVPKSQVPGTMATPSAPTMNPPGYTSSQVPMVAGGSNMAANMPTLASSNLQASNMPVSSNRVSTMPATEMSSRSAAAANYLNMGASKVMAPKTVSNAPAASNMVAGYPHMNFAFKVPDQAQPHAYPMTQVKHGQIPAQLSTTVPRQPLQSPQLPLHSPRVTSAHMTSPSPHMTSPLPQKTSSSPHLIPQSPHQHMPASPHLAQHSPRLMSPHVPSSHSPQSPRIASHSPRIASHSPHMSSHSPRMASQSPHLNKTSPQLNPQYPNKPIRVNTHEYVRPPERDSSFVPLDLTTPKPVSERSSIASSNTDSPLDLSVKPNRKRDHDDDVIVVGEQLIPFKARRLPMTQSYKYPLSIQTGAHGSNHGSIQAGTAGYYGKTSASSMPHPSPYYYSPGGGQYAHNPYTHQTMAASSQGGTSTLRMPDQHSSSVNNNAASPRGRYTPVQATAPQMSPHTAYRTGTGRQDNGHLQPNGGQHTYPYTVTPSGNRIVNQLPHSAVPVTASPVKYVYSTNGSASNANIHMAPPHSEPLSQTPGNNSNGIQVPMSPSHHRSMPPPPDRTPLYPQSSAARHTSHVLPEEKVPACRVHTSYTYTASQGSAQNHPIHYGKSSGVIQHIGAANGSTAPMYNTSHEAHKLPVYSNSSSNNAPAVSTAGQELVGRTHSQSYPPQNDSSADLTVTGHYYQGVPQNTQPHRSYTASTPLSIPRPPSATRLYPTSSNSNNIRQPYMLHSQKVSSEGIPQHGYYRQQSVPGHIQGGKDATGSSSTGQVGRIQPFNQVNAPSSAQYPPVSEYQAAGGHYQHKSHLSAASDNVVGSRVGYLQVAESPQTLQASGYAGHPVTTSTTVSMAMQPLPQHPFGSSGTPHHFAQTVRPTAGRPSEASIVYAPRKPVANVNPIIQRRSPSMLHHKKQMLQQSRLESNNSGKDVSLSCQSTNQQAGDGGVTNKGNLGTETDLNQNSNSVSSVGSDGSLSSIKLLGPADDQTQQSLKEEKVLPPHRKPEKLVVGKAERLDFTKFTRGLDTFRPYEALIKLEQEEQLLKPLSETTPPPTELKIPMVPLKERMKPKDHFGRASPICVDSSNKDTKLTSPNQKPSIGGNKKEKLSKPKNKEAQNAKIHKYYSVKAKPRIGNRAKIQPSIRASDKKAKKVMEEKVEEEDATPKEDDKSGDTGVNDVSVEKESTKKPEKRVYRRRIHPGGFTKNAEGVSRGRRLRMRDDNQTSRLPRGKRVGVELKRKRVQRITKPLSDAKRRKQEANNVVLTTRTRTQTAATKGVRRLSSSCYNKNAAYERELTRDEYRKIINRFKRQNRQRYGRECVRVTRERLGVIFQSDSGSEEGEEGKEDDIDEYEFDGDTDESKNLLKPNRFCFKYRKYGSRRGRFIQRHKLLNHHKDDFNAGDGDGDGDEKDYSTEESDATRSTSLRASRSYIRGYRSLRSGITRENDGDMDYNPPGESLQCKEEEEDDDTSNNVEYANEDTGSTSSRTPSQTTLHCKAISRRAGRGRRGRHFRRRQGAWYDKRRDRKKKKPTVPKEKVETESLDSRSVDDCAGQEALPPAEMARRLVICKETGETLIHKAARLGLHEVVLYCLHNGFDVNSRDNAGYTPLHETCVRGHVTAARLLISQGADINANAHDGTRPMHDAVDNNNVQIVRLLLACGVDTKLVSFGVRDVMRLAKSEAMRQLLRGYFGDLNGPNQERGFEEIPWTFPSSSIFDNDPKTGCDVMADVPDADEAEGFMEFDFCDTPHLPTYHLNVVPTKGALNYHLLDDVLSSLGCSKDHFITRYPDLEILQHGRASVIGLPAQHQPLPSTSSLEEDGSNTNKDVVDLVELDDNLRRILGIETARIPAMSFDRADGNADLDCVSECDTVIDDEAAALCVQDDQDNCTESDSQNNQTQEKQDISKLDFANASKDAAVANNKDITEDSDNNPSSISFECNEQMLTHIENIATEKYPSKTDNLVLSNSNLKCFTSSAVVLSSSESSETKHISSCSSPAPVSYGDKHIGVMTSVCDVYNSEHCRNYSDKKHLSLPLTKVTPSTSVNPKVSAMLSKESSSLPSSLCIGPVDSRLPSTVPSRMTYSLTPITLPPYPKHSNIVPVASSYSGIRSNPVNPQPAFAPVVSVSLPLSGMSPTLLPVTSVLQSASLSNFSTTKSRTDFSCALVKDKVEQCDSGKDKFTDDILKPTCGEIDLKDNVVRPVSCAESTEKVVNSLVNENRDNTNISFCGASSSQGKNSLTMPKPDDTLVETSAAKQVCDSYSEIPLHVGKEGAKNDRIHKASLERDSMVKVFCKPCSVDLVATTCSTDSELNMEPLYTGVAFLSNIPPGTPPEIENTNIESLQSRIKGDLVSANGSQDILSQNLETMISSYTSDSSGSIAQCKQVDIPGGKHDKGTYDATPSDCINTKCDKSDILVLKTQMKASCDLTIKETISEPCTIDEQLGKSKESSEMPKTQERLQGPIMTVQSALLKNKSQGTVSSDQSEMKIGDAPGSSLKQLAHKRQSGEERSISPKAAETIPQEADDIPSSCDGAATPSGEKKKDSIAAPSSNELQKESNNNVSEDAPDTALPVLEKHEREEAEEAPKDKSVIEPSTDDTTDDREMPQLTIQAY